MAIRCAMVGLLCALAAAVGCYGPSSRQRCWKQGDCDISSFCSAAGFCWAECRLNRDCPCGSYCSATCGICVRSDNGKAATCFSHDRGLTDDDVAGVCRGGAAVDADPVGAVSCELPVPMCTVFVPQPSDDAVDASPAVDAGTTPDAAPNTDRTTDVVDASANQDAGTADGSALGDADLDGGQP